MGVHIDPAGGDDLARSVDLIRGIAVNLTNRGDQPVLDGEITGKARRARAIDDGTVANDQIVGCYGRSPLAANL